MFVKTKCKETREEYSALRAEITSRISMIFDMGSVMGTIMLTIWVVNTTLFVGMGKVFYGKDEVNIGFWTYLILITALWCVSVVFVLGMAYKIQENLHQIAMLSSYLNVFYENDKNGFYWEELQNNFIIDLGNFPREKDFSQIGLRGAYKYYIEIPLLLLSSIVLFFVNWILLFQHCKYAYISLGTRLEIQLFLIFVLVLVILLTIIAFFKTKQQVSIEKSMGNFRKTCDEKFKFWFNSLNVNNKPEKDWLIPKKIHYCLFGSEKPDFKDSKYYKSWKEYCKGFEIIEWNDNDLKKGKVLDISKAPEYVKQAYEQKCYAFVSDYFRLKILYENGGIYLDTDVELKKPLDEFNKKFKGFIGFDFDGKQLGTACFGVEKNNSLIKEIMDFYNEFSFIQNNKELFLLANTFVYTAIFLSKGLKPNNSLQFVEDFAVFPNNYFCANDFPLMKDHKKKNCESFAVHDFNLSWLEDEYYYRQKEQEWVDIVNQKANLSEDKKMKSNF